MLFMSCVCHVLTSVHCCLVVTCRERADLLALACDVKLCFCHFPMWYPGAVVSIPDLCCLSYIGKAQKMTPNKSDQKGENRFLLTLHTLERMQ